MFKTKLLSLSLLSLLVPNNLQNFLSGDSQSIYIRFKNLKNKNAGNDERYYAANNNNNTDNTDNSDTLFMLHKIRRHIINKNIIEELENNNTNIHQKIDIIENYVDTYQDPNKISGFNLLAGNLLNEFYDTYDVI
jgi:hypothetical protein